MIDTVRLVNFVRSVNLYVSQTTTNKSVLIMPTGSNNSTHNMTAKNILNLEESADLIAKFETCRKALACPQCAKQFVFRRCGSNKTERS